MENSSQELLSEFEAWFAQNSDALKSVRNNNQVFIVLTKNLVHGKNLHQLNYNFIEAINSISMNMSILATVKIKDPNLFYEGEH